MEEPEPYRTTVPPLKDRWDAILQIRHEIASELEQMARELPGDVRKQLRSLSRWFKGPCDYEEALERPDVLAICLPLINISTAKQISRFDIAQAAQRGFCSAGPNISPGRRLVRLLLYPFLVLLASGLLAVGYSFWIAPQFEEMFAEFGIELPAITLAVLWSSQMVRQWWWLVLSCAIVAAFLCWLMGRLGRDRRPANVSWLDQKLMSTRNALASWAWHISLLLEAGISERHAVKTAGSASANSWLRKTSIANAGNGQSEEQLSGESLFFSPKYQLLECTMRLPTSAGKIALLREVATYYLDRNNDFGDWWIHWIVALMFWFVGVAVLLAVLALFMPLIAIISGLTGY